MTPPSGSLCSIVAVAGRRVDAVDAQTKRFPYANADSVRAALSRALENAAAMLVVASAACGSDLLALDVASVLGIRTRIILPFAPDVFRETSVVDRPHPAYRRFRWRLEAGCCSANCSNSPELCSKHTSQGEGFEPLVVLAKCLIVGRCSAAGGER